MIVEAIVSLYGPRIARTIVYMLQATEYQVAAYLRWLWRTNNFGRVMHRRTLVMTRPAKLLLIVVGVGMSLQYIVAILLALRAADTESQSLILVALSIFLITPILWAHLVVLPLLLGRWLIIKPYYGWQIRRSARIFAAHPAVKLAVAGSYGKTTMKEILLKVLSQGKKVAATPANKNVAISHAQFAKGLAGDEEILIIEYGEGAPGDVARFVRITKPDLGIITGVAPVHLDKYKSLKQAGEDIFTLARYLKDKNIYVNGESTAARLFIKKSHAIYDSQHVAGWTVQNIKSSLRGLHFTLNKDKTSLNLKSSLLGRHQVGPLALAAVIAHQFGLSKEQIEAGITKVQTFEHRMQPYQLSGAWIIDDTYNGNIEGMLAGLQMLKELPARRKVYITPGLVDQGEETPQVHRQLGEAIAETAPQKVVLMKNSVTDYILEGIKEGNYDGDLVIEEDPLGFYTNLSHFVAAGDLVLMQNDWPDNYQ